MGIIAIIMALGVGVYINARNSQVAGDAAEQLKADVRRTQVRAVSTEGSCSTGKPKMWALKVDTPLKKVYSSYFCSDTNQWSSLVEEKRDYTVDSITLDNGLSKMAFIFNAPFGKFFQTDDLDPTTSPQIPLATKDDSNIDSYKPKLDSHLKTYSQIVIKLTYRSISYNVVIDGTTGTANVSATPPPPPPTYILTVNKAGNGTGTVTSSPAGINCGSDCNENYSSGASVTLTAAVGSGSTFAGWSGGSCSGTGACTLTISGNVAVTATFNQSPPPSPPPPNWIAGVGSLPSTVQVYYQDLFGGAWGPYNSLCVGPQCTGSPAVFVADNGVDFTSYPARDACKAIGGRLPTVAELQAIYANKVSYGTFQLSYYWSATQSDTSPGAYAWALDFASGGTYRTTKSFGQWVRCVRGQ